MRAKITQKFLKEKQSARRAESASTEHGSTEGGSRQRNNKSDEDIPALRTDITSETRSRLNLETVDYTTIQKVNRSITYKEDQMKGTTNEIDFGFNGDSRSKYIFGKGEEPDMEWYRDNFGRGNNEQSTDLVSKVDGLRDTMKLGKPNAELGQGGPKENNPRSRAHCTDLFDFTSIHSPNQNKRGNEFNREIRAQRWKCRAREKRGSSNIVSTHGEEKKWKSEGKGGKGDEGELEQAVNRKKSRVGEALS
ncbi:hypothetical protein U1Q18_044443, partial [Sarracenia purpurea var. burkii]